jgi:uncharacterized protein
MDNQSTEQQPGLTVGSVIPLRNYAFDLILFVAGTFTASFVAGLAGFAFGIVAAAVWLHILSPAQATALIVAYGLIVQGWALAGEMPPRQLVRDG